MIDSDRDALWLWLFLLALVLAGVVTLIVVGATQ